MEKIDIVFFVPHHLRLQTWLPKGSYSSFFAAQVTVLLKHARTTHFCPSPTSTFYISNAFRLRVAIDEFCRHVRYYVMWPHTVHPNIISYENTRRYNRKPSMEYYYVATNEMHIANVIEAINKCDRCVHHIRCLLILVSAHDTHTPLRELYKPRICSSPTSAHMFSSRVLRIQGVADVVVASCLQVFVRL